MEESFLRLGEAAGDREGLKGRVERVEEEKPKEEKQGRAGSRAGK
jgi:hypothetical protein